jgi:hypothetical protein
MNIRILEITTEMQQEHYKTIFLCTFILVYNYRNKKKSTMRLKPNIEKRNTNKEKVGNARYKQALPTLYCIKRFYFNL